jgi:hypothetical protein
MLIHSIDFSSFKYLSYRKLEALLIFSKPLDLEKKLKQYILVKEEFILNCIPVFYFGKIMTLPIVLVMHGQL